MLACRLLGHRYRFAADGSVMHWQCVRDCDAGGEKRYASAAEAARYAAAFDREDSQSIGRRPIFALWPLRLMQRMAHRRPTSDD